MSGRVRYDTADHPRCAALPILVGMAVLELSDNFILYVSDDMSLWQFLLLRRWGAFAVVTVIAILGFGVIRPDPAKLKLSADIAADDIARFGCRIML